MPDKPQSSIGSSINLNGDKKRKKRPVVQKNPSFNDKQGNYIYSVDDDLDEIEKDLQREYLEGFNDALRYRYKKSSKNLRESGANSINSSSNDIQQRIISNLINADSNLKKLEQVEVESHDHHNNLGNGSHHNFYQQLENSQHSSLKKSNKQDEDEDEDDDNDNDNNNNNDNENEEQVDYEDVNNEDDQDNASISSGESFTLRERQNAINTTHPFGIRIWKPALYKKIRSVEREADQDIHEVNDDESDQDASHPQKKKKKKYIKWTVHLANITWSLTFGAFLFLINFLGAVILAIVGNLEYSRVFFNLAIYFLWPFGKIVYLRKDKNYLIEDENEGTTLHEYQRWRDEEQSKLFFSPSNTVENIGETSQQQQDLSIDQQIEQSSSQLARSVQSQPQLESPIKFDEQKKRFFGRGDWSLGRIVFYIYFYIIVQPVFGIIWFVCWLLIITIPMAKILSILSHHLRRHPLAIFFKFDSYLFPNQTDLQKRLKKNANVLVCTYRSSGLHYWKYTVDGTNIFLINLLFIVVFTIADFHILKIFFGIENFITNETFIFAMCLLSIIPLAYFIGQAVASISAQSSMGVGAVINAFFSTIVEIFLYCVALDQQKGLLVEGSMIGSILGGVLLLPGLSMCAGALIRKTQRYNPASAGVSSTMLLFSMSVMFAPTVFHQIYGSYEIKCVPCSSGEENCKLCHFFQPPLKIDRLFNLALKPFSIVCAILLFLAYTIGLWFTLRTHAALIWQTPITEPPKKAQESSNSAAVTTTAAAAVALAQNEAEAEPKGHEAPNWSRNKSTIVLLAATVAYAVIAEILVDCVDAVLADFPINPKFLGITIFALVPNTTEFLNAISFATHGNVALSMEIGSAYALQVCLIQIPSLVLYSLFNASMKEADNVRDSMFTLIFPNWDLVASIVSVAMFTYIYAEGKSNYFKGSILILIYVVVLFGFWFTSEIDSQGGFLGQSWTSFIIRND